MTLVVTGGAGFIGSCFIDYYLEKHPGDRVVCLDSLTYAGNMKSLSGALPSPSFRFVRCDITSRESVYDVFDQERPDAVVNFAAESHVDRSISDPSVFIKTNVLGTGVLLDACLAFGVSRFHQVSTDEVYGSLPLDRKDLLFTESSAIKPNSPYSASKASADLLALAYLRTYGLPVSISRCSNNYGPRQFPEKLIPLMVLNASKGIPLPLYGDGMNVRDWIHVSDHARAIDMILHNGKSGAVYNVGARTEISNLDIVKRILRILGRPESLISFVPDRKGHDRRYALDSSLIERELGWRPAVSFDQGLEDTVMWYLRNPEWVSSCSAPCTP
ncbi:MAG: dTDP-glucose 4,6-dehydratase [Candidatus Ornithospirochaeta sp.]|nr:dTDP-glucose 4,6-dehydratase [Candidatus Ornithospirochaeta sp.]